MFGDNREGQLGLGNDNDVYEPTLNKFYKGKTISNIECGSKHAFVLTTNDEIYVTGLNDESTLGLDPRVKNVHTPVLLNFQKSVKEIKLFCYHSFILASRIN